MKKIFLIIFLIIICMPVFADNEFETENSLLYSKKLSKFI